MKKILFTFVLLVAMALLVGCDYEYKNDLKKAIDNYNSTNYTLNITSNSKTSHSFKGEVTESDSTVHYEIYRDGRRELIEYNINDVATIIYNEISKKEVQSYICNNEIWENLGVSKYEDTRIIYTFFDFSTMNDKDFLEVEENKWVALNDKYNKMFESEYLKDSLSETLTVDISDFTVYVEDDLISKVKYTIELNFENETGRYHAVSELLYEFSDFDNTKVEKPEIK